MNRRKFEQRNFKEEEQNLRRRLNFVKRELYKSINTLEKIAPDLDKILEDISRLKNVNEGSEKYKEIKNLSDLLFNIDSVLKRLLQEFLKIKKALSKLSETKEKKLLEDQYSRLWENFNFFLWWFTSYRSRIIEYLSLEKGITKTRQANQ